MTELRIQKVAPWPQMGIPAVVLGDPDGNRILQIGIRPDEAVRLNQELVGCSCTRGSVFGLVGEILSDLGGEVTAVLLDANGPDDLVARVALDRRSSRVFLDCRIADALALAVRLKVPVFATPALARVVDETGVEVAGRSLPDPCEATGWLERVRPGDFCRHEEEAK